MSSISSNEGFVKWGEHNREVQIVESYILKKINHGMSLEDAIHDCSDMLSIPYEDVCEYAKDVEKYYV